MRGEDYTVSENNNGGSLLGLLGIVFIILKLTGHIDWSWWWVTAPFWVPMALALLVANIVALGIYIKKRGEVTPGDPLDAYRSRFN